MIPILLLLGARPAELAPGVPELQESELRLRNLLATTFATQAATARLQVTWTEQTPLVPPKRKPGEKAPPRKGPCDDPTRLEVGWRIERFGAAWREAAQATAAEARRLDDLRALPTVSPLVDAAWSARLGAVLADADRAVASFVEASAWEQRFVRPELALCPLVELTPRPGVETRTVPARGDPPTRTAVLAMGDGWVCPGPVRADDGVVLLDGAGCWSASPTCGCEPVAVAPGAVLGPAPEEATAPAPSSDPAPPASTPGPAAAPPSG